MEKEDKGLWDTAVSWAKTVGEKVIEGEEEMWKRIKGQRWRSTKRMINVERGRGMIGFSAANSTTRNFEGLFRSASPASNNVCMPLYVGKSHVSKLKLHCSIRGLSL